VSAVGSYHFDLTTLAQSWFSGASPNYGVLLEQPGQGVLTPAGHRRRGSVGPILHGDCQQARAAWFKKPISKLEDMKGMKFRTVGLSVDMYTAMGCAVNALPGAEIVPALDRGLLDGAEFNNASSDRALGFQDVSKVCMLQSFHQNAEQFEILFNKDKYNALPAKLRAIIDFAVEAASADMSWKAIDRYSKDYIWLQTEAKVKFYKTPDSVLQKQLEVWDQIAAKKSAENPLFKEVLESQIAFAKRAVAWEMDTCVNRRMAYNHSFGPKKAPAKKG
jgi:TRAP-type mannitol/chloroaromatic compound transport system substrate-binding protein